MKWTDEMDILFRLREILAEEPYQYKPKRKERGQIWKRTAYNLNTLKEPKFTVNHRSVRDRYNILEKKYSKKRKQRSKMHQESLMKLQSLIKQCTT